MSVVKFPTRCPICHTAHEPHELPPTMAAWERHKKPRHEYLAEEKADELRTALGLAAEDDDI
jgi:hypothetical protein